MGFLNHFISLLVKFGIIVVAYRLPIYAESASVDGVRAFYIHTPHPVHRTPLFHRSSTPRTHGLGTWMVLLTIKHPCRINMPTTG